MTIQFSGSGNPVTVDGTDSGFYIVRMTSQSVSGLGTAVSFTGIPSWARRVTVVFDGVSTNGSSNLIVQIGSGSIVTSTYSSASGTPQNASNGATASYTTGFGMIPGFAGNFIYGLMSIVNFTGNIWTSSHSLGIVSGTPLAASGGGSVGLSGPMDRLRITTLTGTDTFDAGNINVMYE